MALTLQYHHAPNLEPEPEREQYPTLIEYLHAWYLWRALRREAELTSAESEARLSAVRWYLHRRPAYVGR